MKEYIERDLVLNHLSCNQEIRFFRVADADGTWVSARDVIRTINKIPAADVVERKRGEWEFGELDVVGAPVRCSCCGWSLDRVDPILWVAYPAHKFCGNCGADMRSHQNILCDQTEEGEHEAD